MLLYQPIVLIFTVLSIPAGVLSRRGSGDSSSDSGTSSDSDDSSSSGGTYVCSDDHILTTTGLQPSYYLNYTMVAGDPGAYTDWNGLYFQGEASFDYVIRDLPTNNTYYGTNCPKDRHSIRMLGIAWVGPRTPTPSDLLNPFTLGFQAWLYTGLPGLAVSQFHHQHHLFLQLLRYRCESRASQDNRRLA
jgi:hypothetical protein